MLVTHEGGFTEHLDKYKSGNMAHFLFGFSLHTLLGRHGYAHTLALFYKREILNLIINAAEGPQKC